jgi:predicted outer membrane repeat protein
MSIPSSQSVSIRIVLLLALLVGIFAATPVHAVASIRCVKWNASGANNGTCWANAYTSLQSALSAAVSGDEIWVAAGTYKPTTGTDRAATFQLKNSVPVYGGFAGNESSRVQRKPTVNVTILSGDIGTLGVPGDNVYHVVTGNSSGSAILDGFTITAGNADGSTSNSFGGGLYKPGAGNLVLKNMIFKDNSAADSGGGLYLIGNSTLTNVSFINNSAASTGGGLYARGDGSLTAVRFKGNSSGYGGGILFDAGSLTINNGTFTNNMTTNDGGAINSAGTLTINTSVFSGNTAYLGAGIMAPEGNVTITNSTFSNNATSGLAGGAGLMSGGTVTISNTTFSSNVADGAGGALFNADPGTMTVKDSTLTNNSGYNGGGIYNAGSLSVVNSIFSGNHITQGSGGAIANFQGTLAVTDSTFSNNNAVVNPYFLGGGGEGGAIYTLSALTISNSTFNGNQASRGGALSCNSNMGAITSTDSTYVSNSALSDSGGDGGAIFVNCHSTILKNTFASNTAAHYGGAILADDNIGLMEITNSTFYGNVALAGSGGGIANFGHLAVSSSTFSHNNASNGGAIRNGLGGDLSLRNSILANSVGGVDCSKSDSTPAVENISNLIETTGTDLASCGSSLLTSDPVLGPLQDNGGPTETMALLPGSPAINAGTNTGCPATDQRGVTRPQQGQCDIGAYESPTVTPFKSGGTQDGWVLETSETSNQGGVTNSTAATFILGDNAGNQQYRSILHFNTSSLPDNARITKVVLKIKKQSVVGTDPFTTHGKIAVDIRKGAFSNNPVLQVTDFQAPDSKPAIGLILNNPQPGGWYFVRLTSAAYPYINRTGVTQFRLRFQTDDDNDLVADFIRFYSGNAAAANRPILVIEYYVP